MNSGYEERLRSYASQVEGELNRWMAADPDREMPYQPLWEAMGYSLLSGGKRIRAVMLLAFFDLYGGTTADALPFAAAMEMIHAYSLVHDDLPCMDDDDLRRGKPSCHIAYGESTAVLAGDALLTLAFETAVSCKLPSERVLQAVGILAGSAGYDGMVGGQVMDLANENKALTVKQLDSINSRKTGALFRACAGIGCILGGGTAQEQEAARSYAEKVGLAFQIVDDMLDVTADQQQLGKPVGSDAENNKNTYAGICGLEDCRQRVLQLNRDAKKALESLPGNTSFLSGLADNLAVRTH